MAKRTNTTQKFTTVNKSSPEQPASGFSSAPATSARAATLSQSPAQRPAPSRVAITHDMIAHRAYEIWKNRGGSEMDNWLRAEQELQTSATASM